MKIEFDRLFEKTAGKGDREKAMEIAERILRGDKQGVRKLLGRLGRYHYVRLDEHRYLVLRIGAGIVKVVAVCRRYSVKYEAMRKKA